MPEQNIVTSFIVEDLNIRGRISHLSSSLNEITSQHNYPEPVAQLLAQISTLATLLGCNLKNNERFSIQIRSDGAIKLLICDFTAPNQIRSYAKFSKDELAQKTLIGEGSLTFLVNEPGATPLYQAIVPLKGDSIAEIAEKYYEQSEQILTKIKLFSALLIDNRNNTKEYISGGFLIQSLPKGDSNKLLLEEQWNEAKILSDTISQDELLDHKNISHPQLLFRLFPQYEVRIFTPLQIIAKCSCSAEKIIELLKNLEGEAQETLEVTCEFCSRRYEIKPSDMR